MTNRKYLVDHDRKGHACVVWDDEHDRHLVCQAMDGDIAQQIANALQDRDYLTGIANVANKVIDAWHADHCDLLLVGMGAHGLTCSLDDLEKQIGGMTP
jgi:hypothetical protein